MDKEQKKIFTQAIKKIYISDYKLKTKVDEVEEMVEVMVEEMDEMESDLDNNM